MRFLKTNTATRITVGPFLNKTDGITPETALTVTSEKLTFMVDDGGVPTLVLDVAPTASGGNNDMVHVTNDDAGFYDLELAAANVNYVGRAMLALTDAANHCPVFHEFMILSAQAYDALCGTGNFSADVIAISGDATAADNLELACDNYSATRGLSGTALPAAAADAAGGLPISDAGGLDIDSIITKLNAIDGYLDTEVAAILAAVDTEIAAIKTRLETHLSGNTLPELSQGIPTATPTLEQAVMLLYMKLRNKLTTTATELAIHNDAGTKIAKATLSDDGTTFEKTELVSGA